MVNDDIIRDTILDNKYISESEIQRDILYKEKRYSWFISCKLEVLEKWIPIKIGISKNWELDLFDFYLVGKLPFIPHIEKNGKLCLFDFEGLVIYPNFEHVLNQCISKARKLIENGILGNNKRDFIEEFDSYFGLLNNLSIANVSLPIEKKDINISFCEILSSSKNKKNKSRAAYIKQKHNIQYFASYNQNDFGTWNCYGTQKNGMYFYIKPSEHIYPPNIFHYKLDEFLNELLSFVDLKSFNRLKCKCGNKTILVFEIQQDEITVNSCGFMIEDAHFLEEDKVKLKSSSKITPLLIKRIDSDYLSRRVSFSSNKIEDKRILLIGCGSIGGYVFHNLIKAGCKYITLVDDDVMKPENAYRHLLGIESAYKSKVKSLYNYAKKTLPEIKLALITKKIEDVIADKNLSLSNFDYIISATGSHMVNRWLNKYLIKNNIYKTIFYIWNEPLDIGCHVARINIKDGSDYSNIFGIDSGNPIDLSSYVKNGQRLAKTYTGCHGTFIPYGSTLSIESSAMFIDLLKREAEGRLEGNIIVSKKGDDYYFNKAGFSVSERYVNQKERYVELPLSELGKDDVKG